jgi:hypothetical protein
MADVILFDFQREFDNTLDQDDILYFVDVTGPTSNKIKAQRFVPTDGNYTQFTGGGTIALGNFTLTCENPGIVGLKDVAQTWTNKTFTTPTIASLVNAAHDHTDAAGGGGVIPEGTTMSIYSGSTAHNPFLSASTWSTTESKVSAGFYLDGDVVPVNATVRLFAMIGTSDGEEECRIRLWNDTAGAAVTGSVGVVTMVGGPTYIASGDFREYLASGLNYYYLQQMFDFGGRFNVHTAGLIFDVT